jgi:hypothetical protein
MTMVGTVKNQLLAKIPLLAAISIFFIFVYALAASFERLTDKYTKEDGTIENLGAAFFFFSFVLLVVAFARSLKATQPGDVLQKRKNYWVLALALLFFVAFGEEISWGQRIFNFETPGSIKAVNIQREFNLHNLQFAHGEDSDGNFKTGLAALLTMHSLFYIFLFVYFVVMPLVVLVSAWASRLFTSLGIPVVPLWIGLTFLIVVVLAKFTQFISANDNRGLYHDLVEIKETNIALVTMLMAGYLLSQAGTYSAAGRPVGSPTQATFS